MKRIGPTSNIQTSKRAVCFAAKGFTLRDVFHRKQIAVHFLDENLVSVFTDGSKQLINGRIKCVEAIEKT
jgi:hypothetical protein